MVTLHDILNMLPEMMGSLLTFHELLVLSSLNREFNILIKRPQKYDLCGLKCQRRKMLYKNIRQLRELYENTQKLVNVLARLAN